MSRKTIPRWIYLVGAAVFLVAGLLQLLQGLSLGWAAIVAAVPIGMGLALSVKIRWGWLVARWGVVDRLHLARGRADGISRPGPRLFFRWLGRRHRYGHIHLLAKPPRRSGRPSEERVHRFTGQAIGVPGQKGMCNAVRSGYVWMGMTAAI